MCLRGVAAWGGALKDAMKPSLPHRSTKADKKTLARGTRATYRKPLALMTIGELYDRALDIRNEKITVDAVLEELKSCQGLRGQRQCAVRGQNHRTHDGGF